MGQISNLAKHLAKLKAAVSYPIVSVPIISDADAKNVLTYSKYNNARRLSSDIIGSIGPWYMRNQAAQFRYHALSAGRFTIF